MNSGDEDRIFGLRDRLKAFHPQHLRAFRVPSRTWCDVRARVIENQSLDGELVVLKRERGGRLSGDRERGRGRGREDWVDILVRGHWLTCILFRQCLLAVAYLAIFVRDARRCSIREQELDALVRASSRCPVERRPITRIDDVTIGGIDGVILAVDVQGGADRPAALHAPLAAAL